jgi:hypothetical protein
MIQPLFWLFVSLLILPALGVIQKPERLYEFPYFMAATFGSFILPQVISLCRFPGAASEQAIERVLAVTCLCLATCLIGYKLFARTSRDRVTVGRCNEARLLQAGMFFVASGFCFGYLLGHTEIQTSESGGWTGTATIYGFFQQLCYPGLAMCLMVAIRRPTALSIFVTLLAAVVPLQSLIFGRREPAALLALTVGLTVFFQLRVRPPRLLVLAGLVGAALIIPATGTYRRYQQQQDWEAVRQIDLAANFRDYLEQESILELRNAAMLIEATRRCGGYEYGAGYWNHLIFRYVPAQVLGANFKESLMIRRGEAVEQELAAMDYTNPPGSTVTGMGDSFQQFGYFGCLFFAAAGVLFRRLWCAALVPEALFAQLLYMQSCTCAMRSVTHWTLDFLPGLLYNLFFLGAAALYVSTPGRARRHLRTAPRANERAQPAGLSTLALPPGLFAQGFGHNENEHGPAQPSTKEEIQKRVTYRRKHGCY